MSITDHRPWRGIAAVIHHHRHGEHETVVEVADITFGREHAEDASIGAWLASGDEQAATVELPRIAPPTGPDDLQGVARMPFTVHRELDDDERFAASMLEMERRTQALADTLAGENDTRMTLLLAASERAVRVSSMRARYVEALFAKAQFQRRKARITPLVNQVGHLLAQGDVSPETAVALVSLRSRYLSSPDDSQRIPMMTPARLAELDAQKASAS